MPDVTTTQIATGLAGTVTTGTLVMLIMQNVKSLTGDWLQGPRAEAAGGLAALAAVVVAFILASADWQAYQTGAELFVSWMSTWVAARASYALLFKVSIAGSPPSSQAAATVVTDPAPDNATTTVVKGKGT